MKQYLIILAVVLCLGLVSALPPQAQTALEDEITIFYPKYEFIPQNTAFNLHFHVINKSQTLTAPQTSCEVHLYDINGKHTLEELAVMDSNGIDYKVTITGGNFSNIGTHAYIIQCNTSKQTGGASGDFEVTLNGIDKPDALIIVIFSIIFLLLLGGATTSLLKNIGHWVNLEVNMFDVAFSFSIYFIVFSFYYLVKTFLGDPMILDITKMMLFVRGISHILVPIYSLAASMIWNPIKLKERSEARSWN